VDGSRGVWNRDFRIVLVGQGVSALGDAISFVVTPLLVLLLTGSGIAMGTVGVLTTLPDFLFGLPAGALADRLDRRRLMLAADFGRGILTGLIPLSFMFGWDTMAVILLVTFPINVLRVLFMSGFSASMPSLVGREHVGRATGYTEAIFGISFTLGPAVAGLLAATIGPAPTLAIDAFSFIASAASLSLVRRPLQERLEQKETHLFTEIAEGVRFVLGHRLLRTLIAFWGTVSVVSAPLVPAVIYFLTKDRGEPASTVGLVISSYGVGYLIGSIVAGRFSRGPLGKVMIAGNVVQALMLCLFPLSTLVPVYMAGAFAAGLSGALVLISYITLRAVIPPDALLGRVGSTARVISFGLQPIGMFVGGLLLDLVHGGPTIFLIAAGMLTVTLIYAVSSSLRGARAESAAAAPATG
jgi:MFS family permease